MRRFLLFILIFGFFLFLGKAYYDTNAIEIKHYEIKSPSLSEPLRGLKIAFLTDLHIKDMGIRENKILEILREEKPDMIFLSGDYIAFKGSYKPVMFFFSQLKAPLGIYAVFGNTEYTNENGSCIFCHYKGSKGLKKNPTPYFLRNSAIVLEANQKKINIVGVDDPVEGKSDLNKALKDLDKKYPIILLAHSPEIFEEATANGVDFLLCGHNHGGQLFFTRYLRDVLPLDATLEFIDGFFKKAKTLMYVNRGIGTSFLPFRLGVKPEITFFEFTNGTNEKANNANKKTRLSQIHPINKIAALPHHSTNNLTQTMVCSSTPFISNRPSQTIFAGLTLRNFLETFNVLGIFNPLIFVATSQNFNHSDFEFRPSNLTPPPSPLTPHANILFDFESQEELERLNWECGKWFELSEENVTSAKRSLKVSIPPGQYPGINFEKITKNWSRGRFLKMDVFNPSEERIPFHIRIDDHKSGWEYANRFDINFILEKGMNHISIPTNSIKTNIHQRPLNLKRIERMMVFVPDNSKRRELFIDHIRLE